MASTAESSSNRLLATLPGAERTRWAPYLEAVDLTLGQVLCESGCPPRHAYFPTTAIVSLLYITEDGASAEIAVIGNEGVVGTPLFMGGATMPGRAVVQSAGRAWRMPAYRLVDEFSRSAGIRQLLLRYAQALMVQTAQTALCNRHHTIDQQLCRWLLLCLDRQPGSDVVMTQELIAGNLGVRREGVTASEHKLQRLGLIHCWRGHIRVLDRRGLEDRACECYAAVRAEYDRLLPEVAIAEASAAGHLLQYAPAAVAAHIAEIGRPPWRGGRRVEVVASAP